MPAEIGDSVHHTLSNDAAVKARFAKQAAKDWDTYLTHRATELRKGGQVCAKGSDRCPGDVASE